MSVGFSGKECSGVKIVVLADIHGDLKSLYNIEKALSGADVVLVAGDITNFGDAEQAAAVMEVIQKFCKRVLAVPGNCDPASVNAYLTEAGVNLNGHGVCVDSCCFVGVGGAVPSSGSEASFTKALDKAYRQCDGLKSLVVVTHQPAWGTAMDAVAPGRHAGSRAIREFIEHTNAKLAVSGHIHEIIGTGYLGSTTLVNPGPTKEGHYAVVELNGDEVRVRCL